MKPFLFSYKFLFVVLMALPLSLCSKDDENKEPDFEPIEITFTEDFFTDCNQIKTIQGINLSYEKNPDVDQDCLWYEGVLSNDVNPNEISLLLAPAVLKIDISSINDVSKITIIIYDNCGLKCTKTSLYENTSIITTIENSTIQETENFVFDVTANSTQLIVSSFEGYVQKIIVE